MTLFDKKMNSKNLTFNFLSYFQSLLHKNILPFQGAFFNAPVKVFQ